VASSGGAFMVSRAGEHFCPLSVERWAHRSKRARSASSRLRSALASAQPTRIPEYHAHVSRTTHRADASRFQHAHPHGPSPPMTTRTLSKPLELGHPHSLGLLSPPLLFFLLLPLSPCLCVLGRLGVCLVLLKLRASTADPRQRFELGAIVGFVPFRDVVVQVDQELVKRNFHAVSP
jgi:hypothetical protein